jgi:predicted nuclease of restriction endonuclease-like (RecB) superfamily
MHDDQRDRGEGLQVTQRSYAGLLVGLVELLEQARRSSGRSINAIMTATYWEIGRRIVEHEQQGKARAGYGEALIERLAADLKAKFGRGFSRRNLLQMREFYIAWPIVQTPSAQLQSATASQEPAKVQTPSAELLEAQPQALREEDRYTGSGKSGLSLKVFPRFPLPWSHYVRLLSVKDPQARAFYETEALRGGWSVRQLDRQISSLFYQRTALSRNKAGMLRKGQRKRPGDRVAPEEEIKDPLVLEFLGLKDEYSETALEEALILHLERFLLELGNDFAFVARQKRLRVGDTWSRVDLVFFHRRLRALILVDLKVGELTHADTGQMNLYLNYAREHWTHPDENPPVGLILCSERNEAVAYYALGNLGNKVLASEYKLALPSERRLQEEMTKTMLAIRERLAASKHGRSG